MNRLIQFTRRAGLLAIAAGTLGAASLTMDDARRVLSGALQEAEKRKTTGTIAVVDEGGNLLTLERLDGTFAASAGIAAGKARTAALFQKPTRAFEEAVNKGRVSMVALAGGAMEGFTPLQGGIPLMSGGRAVGAVGVSGAASAQEDEELAMAAARAFESGPAPVVFFESASVRDAFAKGSVLFDHSDKYMVHASRRDKPGMAEIHTRDADIVHVLEGSATIVTGGRAVNAKETGPGELRGDSIEGGEERQLSRGDVIIVPAGTPHWFKQVSSPFLYYVVKAR